MNMFRHTDRLSVCPQAHSMTAVLALALMAGAAHAQSSVVVSGLEHDTLGAATFDPPSERRLPIRNIGSSGQDGVEIRCGSSRGVSCDVDLTDVAHTPGAVCKATFQDLNFVAVASLTMGSGGGGGGGAGGILQSFDYTPLGAIGTRWVVRDAIGGVMAEGTSDGPVLTTSVSGSSPLSPSVWNVRTRINDLEASLKHLGLLAECRSGTVTVSGLTSTPITGATSVECFPIICITSPCPGGWGGVSSMRITASGVPGIDVSNAAHGLVASPPSGTPTSFVTKELRCYATGGLSIDEPCAGLPENCPPAEATTVVTGWGTTPDDALVIDLGDLDQVGSDGVVRRDKATSRASVDYDFLPASGTPGASHPGMTFESQGRKWGNGHVTLMKAYDDGEPATGARLLGCDATGMDATECTAACLDASGQVLYSEPVGPSARLRIDGTPARISTNLTVARFALALPGQCAMPSGTVVQGVSSVSFTPIKPRSGVGIDKLVVKGHGIARCTLGKHLPTAIITCRGVVHTPIGSASVSTVTGSDGLARVRCDNLGSSGQDGVEVLCGGLMGGSVETPLSTLPPGSQLKVRYRGWDGLIYKRVSATATSPGTLSILQDMTPTGATSLHWRALSSTGSLLGEGDLPGASLQCDCVLMPEGGLPPSSMSLRHNGYDLKKAKKRTEVCSVGGAMRVTVPGSPPMMGVTSIQCDVYPPVTMLSRMDGTQAIMVTSNAPSLEVANPAACNWSLGASNPTMASTAVGGEGLGAAMLCPEFTVPETSPPELYVSNIGSSGQDGVRLHHFQTGDVPTQQQFSFEAAMINGWSLGASNPPSHPSSGRMSMRHTKSGHVTLLKFEVFPDPMSPTPVDNVSCDVSARGSFTATATFSDGTSIVGTAHLPHGSTCQIPCCSGFARRYGVDNNGVGKIDMDCPVTVSLDTGISFSNVRSITFTPENPTVPAGPVEGCDITGAGFDTMVISRPDLGLGTCPADLGRQGGLVGGDGVLDNNDFVAFIDMFFSGASGADLGVQGGLPGHDGHMDNNDFVVFIDAFFHGCPG